MIQRIGVFGGTFDPLHIGHLAIVRWARDELALDRIKVIPTGQSWQKASTQTSAQHRLAMLKLGMGSEPGIDIDEREVLRSGPSYTIDTLTALRSEIGPNIALVFVLGSDQLHNLASWHRYRELLGLAHLAVTQRESIRLRDFPPAIETLLQQHGQERLPDAPAGSIVFFRMPMVPVSATVLRSQLAQLNREPARAAASASDLAQLVPGPVLDYIKLHELYQT